VPKSGVITEGKATVANKSIDIIMLSTADSPLSAGQTKKKESRKVQPDMVDTDTTEEGNLIYPVQETFQCKTVFFFVLQMIIRMMMMIQNRKRFLPKGHVYPITIWKLSLLSTTV
jgi:hypothetical protein